MANPQAGRAAPDAVRSDSFWLREALTATYWFEAERRGSRAYSVSVRFSGNRSGVAGKPGPADHFETVETVADVVPGSGWVAVTTKVQGLNPGEWVAVAQPIRGVPGARRTAPGRGARSRGPRDRLRWGTPAMSPALPARIKTSLAPFATAPGSFPLAWISFVGSGVIAGLVIQAILANRFDLDVRAGLAISALALIAGFLGAKAWYLVLQRQLSVQAFVECMCIQGFIAGAAAALLAALPLTRLPVGPFLDVAAPGLCLGLAIGRPGCFFAGCCAGRCTASRWGIWSSDRRMGARRIPAQLLEALLSLAVGLAALGLVLTVRPARPGAIAVGAVAAYALGRQPLFGLRSEARRSRLARPLVAVVSAIVLAADLWFGIA